MVLSSPRHSLFFLHIPKTAGVSLTEALRGLYPPDRVHVPGDGIGPAYLADRFAGDERPAFVAGHPLAGALRGLPTGTKAVTLLRRPEDQAVSHYLHARDNSDHADHAAALRWTLLDFLRGRPDLIAFQTHWLASALGGRGFEAPCGDPALVFYRACQAMDRMDFVGVSERMEACALGLSALLGGCVPIQVSVLNTAAYRGVSAREMQDLRAQYRALSKAPELAHLFALEQALYLKAEGRLARTLADLEGADPAAPSAPRRWNGERFRSAVGELLEGSWACAVPKTASNLVHGPYCRVEAGPHEAWFDFDLEGRLEACRLVLEVAINGREVAARRVLRGADLNAARRRRLRFRRRGPEDIVEFRIHGQARSDARLIFRGVEVTPA
jgi:hypothetical protein